MSSIGALTKRSQNHVPKIDAILLEVLANALDSIVEEAGEVLIRASHSPTVKERRDSSTALFDRDGQTLCQAAHIPLHFGSLYGVVESIVSRHPIGTIQSGDIFIGNDAYVGGGTHLNDIVIVEPIFVEGRIEAWTANVAHHADFADRGHAHIFQEGLRIPPVKLFRAGEINNDLQELILLNCQIPDERMSDLRAQISANRFAIRRFLALCEKYGVRFLNSAFAALLDSSEQRMRAGITSIPDGVYSFEDDFDHSEIDDVYMFGVTIEVTGSDITLNFRAPPQVRASLNLVKTALAASTYYAIKVLTDPYAPSNAGLFRPIQINATEASMLNASPPAAVYGRACAAQRVVDLVHGALAQAIPDRVTAAHNGSVTGNTCSGVNPRTKKFYVYGETIGGGFGARAGKDGLDGVHTHITNSANMPIEALEIEYPITVECYELIQDSGGPGRYRGGMGIHRSIRIDGHECRIDVRGSRLFSGPWGLDSGMAGAKFSFAFDPPLSVPYKKYVQLGPGHRVSVMTPGGGGHGNPIERDRSLVLRDLRDGRISEEQASQVYGLERGTFSLPR
jgi:N-methylhydantoinase B